MRGVLGRPAAMVAALLLLLCPAIPSEARQTPRQEESQRYLRLSRIQFEQGKTQEALEAVHSALKMDAGNSDAHYFLGVIRYQLSEYKPAVKSFRKAIKLNPYFTDAHNHLGLVYREMQKYDKALEEFHTALNDKSYRSQEKIHFNIGHLYLARKMYPEAIASFQKAIQVSPAYLRGILGLGTAYAQSGQKGLAEKELQKVVALDPDSPEAAEARQLLGLKVKQAGS
jgi:tetratricopeptide (TPR) repeat protein